VDVVKPEPRVMLEAAVSAHRERGPDGRVRPSPDWCDLSPDSREALFEEQLLARRLEALASPDGLSGTVRAVLARIRGLRD
jgi:hypothetical protein